MYQIVLFLKKLSANFFEKYIEEIIKFLERLIFPCMVNSELSKGNQMKRVLMITLVSLSLAGCNAVSEYNLNPMDWFGSSEE